MPIPWTNENELFYVCGYKCTLCGSILIQKHHIDGNSNNDVPDNWTVLCQPHHDLANRDLQVVDTHTRKLTPAILKEQRKRHIESFYFNRFGWSRIDMTGEIEEQLDIPAQAEENQDPAEQNLPLLQRLINWLNEK
jgi:hypothetical protein